MNRFFRQHAVRGAFILLFVAFASDGRAATTCGNGIIDANEECDPGTSLFIDGDAEKGVCQTGSRCYFQFTCCKFNCQFVGTPALPCDDGNSCTSTDFCGQLGTCKPGPAVVDATPCDDGVFCNGTESCHSGVCGAHTGDPCPGTVCNECQEETESCFNPAGESPCNDSVCVSGGECDGAGTCVAGVLTTGPCDDGLYCNGSDTCSDGTCSNHSGNPCAFTADGDANCQESCDEAADSCTGADVDGTACDDTLNCDGVADVCIAGNCAGTGSVACDDGNPCTEETCDEILGCTVYGPSADDTPCEDGDPCTRGDRCVAGFCVGDPGQLEDFCPWTVVLREGARGDMIRTGPRTEIDGDVCGGTMKFGARTSIQDDLVSDEETGSSLRLSPHATIGGDIVSNGAGAKAFPASGILPYSLVSVLSPGVLQAKNDATGVYALDGAAPLGDQCATARDAYPATTAELDVLPSTDATDRLRVAAAATGQLIAPNPGALNVIDIDGGIRLGKDAVLELGGGGDAATVLVLRVHGKLELKAGSSISLVGGLTSNHVLIYVDGKACKFGDLTFGSGTLVCSPARVKTKRDVAWIGAVFADGFKMVLGEFTAIRYEPFVGF